MGYSCVCHCLYVSVYVTCIPGVSPQGDGRDRVDRGQQVQHPRTRTRLTPIIDPHQHPHPTPTATRTPVPTTYPHPQVSAFLDPLTPTPTPTFSIHSASHPLITNGFEFHRGFAPPLFFPMAVAWQWGQGPRGYCLPNTHRSVTRSPNRGSATRG